MSEILGDVEAGREAWQRLRHRKDWEDWVLVGTALVAGRTAAMKIANTNRAVGSRYNKAVGAWLRENGFDGISAQERYKAIRCIENRTSIEAWRDSLDEAKRRRFNHPNAVWCGWRRATRPHHHHARPALPQNKGRYQDAVHWSQDCVRRAAEAMRQSRSNDLFVLARVALEATIRGSDDLDLLAGRPKPKPAPVKEWALV